MTTLANDATVSDTPEDTPHIISTLSSGIPLEEATLVPDYEPSDSNIIELSSYPATSLPVISSEEPTAVPTSSPS